MPAKYSGWLSPAIPEQWEAGKAPQRGCSASAVAEKEGAKTGTLTGGPRDKSSLPRGAHEPRAGGPKIPTRPWQALVLRCGSSQGAWQSTGSQDAFGLLAVDAQPAGRSPHNHSFRASQSRGKLIAVPALSALVNQCRRLIGASMRLAMGIARCPPSSPCSLDPSRASHTHRSGVRGNSPASHLSPWGQRRPLGPRLARVRKRHL